MSLVVWRKKKSVLLTDTASSLLIGGAVVLALDLGRRIFRRSQLFVPERNPVISWNPEDYGIPRERTEVLSFETDDGELLYGWYCRAEHPIASALYCHGNTGNLTNTAHIMPYLLDAGINMLLFDYRGFGGSEGEKWRLIPLEQIDDIRNAISFFEAQPQVDPERIGLWGTSFGGANAPYAAAVDSRVKAVVGQVGFGDGDFEPAFGLFGGHDSMLNSIELCFPDGTRVVPRNKDLILGVPKGTLYHQIAGGGGGYGDPRERDRKKVAEEVRNGVISPQAARDVYGYDGSDK